MTDSRGIEMFEVPGDRLRELTSNIEGLQGLVEQKDSAIRMLGENLQTADVAIRSLATQKDNAYTERNYLVAVISKIWPSHLTKHLPADDPDWHEQWLNVVCVHVAGKRCAWHIHDSEVHLFHHLKQSPIPDHDYDGMTTAEKYGRLSRLPVVWTTV